MSDTNTGGCVGCLGSVAILTVIGSLFFGGGILYRIGTWQFALGGDVVDRQSIIASYWNELESDKKVANESIQKFRAQIEQKKYQAAYDQASTPFKQSLTLSKWISACETINQDLGSVKSAQLMNAWVQPSDKPSEKYVLLRYATTFGKGQIQEDFIWLVKDSKPELIQYFIHRSQPMEDPKNTQVMSLIDVSPSRVGIAHKPFSIE